MESPRRALSAIPTAMEATESHPQQSSEASSNALLLRISDNRGGGRRAVQYSNRAVFLHFNCNGGGER